MNARNNSDKICDVAYPNYNAIHNVEDISGSGTITEPVSLQEAKDYLRMEGFADDGSAIVPEDPVNLTLLAAGDTVTSALLIGKSILNLTRSGLGYTQVSSSPGSLEFTFDDTTGEIVFGVAAGVGNEPVVVLPGDQGVSSGNVFTFDDDLITSLITEGRIWCEKYTGVHLVEKTLRVDFTCGNGMLQFPGPVTSTIGSQTITDKNGVVYTGQVFWIGTLFPKLETTFADRMHITYAAGYGSDCPEWAINAIKAYVADHYEYRGDDAPPAANERAAQKCRPHRRVNVWA